jgi:hypothetical protein
MGSTRHYFLLPDGITPIDTGSLVARLICEGWDVESGAFLFKVASDGVTLSSRDVKIASGDALSLGQSLHQDERLLRVFSHSYLPINMILGPPGSLSVQVISHSVKLWERLSPQARARIEEAIATGASDSGAGLVLVIDDPPDDILGRIVRVDDRWLIDLAGTGYQIDPCRLWSKDTDSITGVRDPAPTGEFRSTYQVFVEVSR